MAANTNGRSSTAAASTAPSKEVDSTSGDPSSFPLAAQIALKEFKLPDFPPEGSRLRQLTLTADIKLDEYQNMVQSASDALITQPPLPDLPQSITHLNLELFGLGFPGKPPFLSRLARSLPNLRSVTFFSCLIDGLDDASRKDAEGFFRNLPLLQELHIIDSFARPGFFKTIGGYLDARAKEGQEEFKVVDVSYTFRGHEDSDFLARVQGEELSSLVVKGMLGASFDFVPEVVDDLAKGTEGEDAKKEKEKIAEGVLPFASDGRAPAALKKRFENLSSGGFQGLKVLNLGMWSLRPADVGNVVYACAGGGEPALVDLAVSVLLEENWMDELVKGLSYNGVGAALEGIEVIGVPDRAKEEGEDWKHGLALTKLVEVQKLASVCPKLGKFGMGILKVGSAPHVLFLKDQGTWKEI